MEVMLKHVPREENHKADELALLISSLGEWIARDVVIQVELLPHIEITKESKEDEWRMEFLCISRKAGYQLIPFEIEKSATKLPIYGWSMKSSTSDLLQAPC